MRAKKRKNEKGKISNVGENDKNENYTECSREKISGWQFQSITLHSDQHFS